jgi:hypothetical protein
MFGLESDKKKKPTPDFDYELEKELKDLKLRKEILGKIEDRLTKIKAELHSGKLTKEEFDQFITLQLGYESALKIMQRVIGKK